MSCLSSSMQVVKHTSLRYILYILDLLQFLTIKSLSFATHILGLEGEIAAKNSVE